MARYNECGARGLFGHDYFGFLEKDLNFLALAKLKPLWLWFWDVDLVDVEALYEVEELDGFGIHTKRPGIDFARFRRIKSCTHHWLKSDRGITQAPISDYLLWHFKPRSKSFADLEIPLTVKKLELNWCNPASLDGLPVLEHLKELEIHRCRNLADLSALPRVAPNLRHLLTTTSSQIVPTAGILDHPKLKTARISGKEMVAIEG